MRVRRGRGRKLGACAAAAFFAQCTASSGTDTEAGIGAPDARDVDYPGLDEALGTEAATLDATDAIGAVGTTEAGSTEHVVPDGVYDCDVVEIRCNASVTCTTPQLGILDGGLNSGGNGVLLSFEMTLSGSTVAISAGYSCTGTWYAAGDPMDDVLGPLNGFAPGGFVCLVDQPLFYCNEGGFIGCSSPPHFVIWPTDPFTTRNNADGGALQPGEIYAGLWKNNAYNAHCAPKR